MSISINQIVNANVYTNGVSQMGRANEVKIPDIEFETIEHKGLYELINDKLNQIRKAEYDLDELLGRLSNNNNYSSLHIDALNAYSEDDYYC